MGLHPDFPAVPFDHFPGDGEADSAARILGVGVQALEDFKNSRGVLRVDPDSVVGYGKDPFCQTAFGPSGVRPGPAPRAMVMARNQSEWP